MRRLRGSVGCLAVVLAAMSGCADPGQEAPETGPVAPVQRSAHLVGTPGLVSDLQPTPPPDRTHSYPRNFVVMGTTRFFTASDPMHGRELWKSDGTPAGTVLVADITPGREDSSFSDFTLAHGVLYFVVDGFGADERLWRSDGTAEGTRPVFTDPTSPLIVSDAVAFKGTLYLVASSDFGRSYHLWTSDGTREGTTVVKTFLPGRAPWGLSRMGERLFFTADDGVHGSEPWVSDGTAAGTVMLKDLAPGSASSSLRSFAVAGSVFYFTLGVSFSGTQLWKSDGTSEGTVPLTNVPGEPIAVPDGPRLMDLHWLMFSGGTLFFSAKDGLAGQELWKSDGTPAGTVRVKDIHPTGDAYPQSPRDANGVLVFEAREPGTGRELWRSDGTAEGTVRLTDLRPGEADSVSGPFAVAGSRVYFFTDPSTSPYELWTSDGTPAGARRVRSFTRTSASLYDSLGFADGSLLFVASDDVRGDEPWMTDGTPEGTVLLRDIHRGAHGSSPQNMMDLGGGRLLFALSVSGRQELWSSDGTEAGTRRVLAGLSALGTQSWRMGGVRYFAASTTDWYANTLWRSDGTPEGTFALQDFPSGLGAITAERAGRIFFSAATPTEGMELWASDGTREGTVRVKDIRPGSASSSPRGLFNVGGTLYFTADDGVHGAELWKTDGTVEGTVLVTDLVPGSMGANPMDMENLNGTLVFIASEFTDLGGGYPWEKKVLWRLGPDGQPRKISFPAPAPGVGVGEPARLRVVNGTLLVFVDPFVSQLWVYDGTSEHATLLSGPGLLPLFPLVDLVAAGRVLYFLARGGPGGVELWRSDGTVAGTSRVKEVSQTWKDGEVSPSSLLGLADRGQVLLRSWVVTTGVEMWTSDGSEAGTSLVADLAPGPSGSDPRSFTRSGDSVFFSADDGVHGAELWRLPLPPVAPDTTPPVVVCPAGLSAEPTSSAGAIVSWLGVRVSDDVTASIPLTYSHVPGSTFPLGKTVVTVTARDEAGNAASCTFDVWVRDASVPAVVCPADVTTEATSPEGAPVTFAEATAGEAAVTYSHARGGTFPVGETVVTATAKDADGNTGTCTFHVTVKPGGTENEDEDEGGSGCTAAGGSPAGLLGLLLLLAWPSLGRARTRRGGRRGPPGGSEGVPRAGLHNLLCKIKQACTTRRGRLL
ncbi:HYR domain-containing protein [Archangium gephyra]|uniref:ELWxxDGT repeat protein n=1 Tax=Archangium gephyra TaxID=48 RepID=UPI0035D40D5B